MIGLALLANAGATLALAGLIWTVQVSLYPLFAYVGPASFPEYHRQHSNRITALVGPLMLVELVTAVALAIWPPAALGRLPFVLGLGLVLVAWASTAFVQVPLHGALGSGFSAEIQARLVQTNWLRTAAWSARGAVVLWMLARLLPSNV